MRYSRPHSACLTVRIIAAVVGFAGLGLPRNAVASDPPATTRPTLTAYPSGSEFLPASSGPTRVSFGKTVAVTLPSHIEVASFHMGSVSEDGLMPIDQTIFFAIQVYSVAGFPDSTSDQDLAPAAIEQLRSRWASLIADDSPIEIQHNPKLALELHYSMNLCHGVVPLVDRYAKVGKNLMRVTVIPMSQTLTPEQFAILGDKAEQTTQAIIASAKPYNEQAEKNALKAKQATAAAAPLSGAAQNPFARGGTTGFPTAKPAKPTAADLLTHRAELALAQADKLKADGKDEDAYDRYEFIAKQYAKTPSATPAKDAIASYEADPDFMSKYKGKGPTTRPTASQGSHVAGASVSKAQSMLSLADSYANAGQTDLARQKYQSVIDQFPNTPEAAKAKEKLTAM